MAEEKLKVAAIVEKRVKERDKIFLALQKIMDSFIETYKHAVDHDLKTYMKLTDPDCLYNDSPISPSKTNHWIKEYFLKHDLHFLGGITLDGKAFLKDLIERSDESSRWVMRFTKEPEVLKTGINKILEG